MDKETWLKERQNVIGGSDASAIIGCNPWKTNQQVWKEKINFSASPINNNELVEYGQKAEKPLAELFSLDFPQYKLTTKKFFCIKHKEFDFIGGTIDGELLEKSSGRKGVLEIKTASILRVKDKEKWDGKLPQNYYTQLIHYMMAGNYDFGILKAQLKTVWSNGEIYLQTKHYPIERSEVIEDIKYLELKEIEFWNNYVITKKEPPLILPEI